MPIDRCLLSRCAENVVPKRRANAESYMIIFVMMTEVILLQPKPNAALHGEMVCRVMKHVVANVAENESRKDARRQMPKY